MILGSIHDVQDVSEGDFKANWNVIYLEISKGYSKIQIMKLCTVYMNNCSVIKKWQRKSKRQVIGLNKKHWSTLLTIPEYPVN